MRSRVSGRPFNIMWRRSFVLASLGASLRPNVRPRMTAMRRLLRRRVGVAWWVQRPDGQAWHRPMTPALPRPRAPCRGLFAFGGVDTPIRGGTQHAPLPARWGFPECSGNRSPVCCAPQHPVGTCHEWPQPLCCRPPDSHAGVAGAPRGRRRPPRTACSHAARWRRPLRDRGATPAGGAAQRRRRMRIWPSKANRA
jgi:hypothetical protein